MRWRALLAAAGLVLAAAIAIVFASRELPSATSAAVAVPAPAQLDSRTVSRTIRVALPAPAGAPVRSGGVTGVPALTDGVLTDAVADARAGRIDPVELGLRLRATGPGSGAVLLRELEKERSPALLLQLALALGARLDDPALLADTVRSLRAGSDELRAVGLLALLGRDAPDALRLAADTLASGSPDARATAAFLLNNAPAALSGDTAERALAAARKALSEPDSGARLREEAATLLGRPPATAADLALLERTVFTGEPAVRMRALAALEAAGANGALLRDIFDRAAHDATAPERLVEMANAWRAMHP